jgi:hypothetical protein
MRAGRVAAILATAASLTFASALLISAGGCSGSSGTATGPAKGGDEEGQKLLAERMKENMAGKNPMQVPKQNLPNTTKKK